MKNGLAPLIGCQLDAVYDVTKDYLELNSLTFDAVYLENIVC